MLVATCALASTAGAAPATDPHDAALIVSQLPAAYSGADRTHDEVAAAHVRRLAALAAANRANPRLDQLVRLLEPTKVRLQPWPFDEQVRSLATGIVRALGGVVAVEDVYGAIDDNLDGDPFHAAVAEALYVGGPGLRLQELDPSLRARTVAEIDRLIAGAGSVKAARDDVTVSAQTLGDVKISRAAIVGDAAVIVFREGLEAVLILAALTASFTGARLYLRRPVLLGALLGLAATAITWVIAQTIINSLSAGGLELQAITGLLAIGVLLLVTNWFFHKVYWSEWIGRFNRKRKSLETGVVSGQAAGFVLLGLTSVYREGFETVLFLQSLQTSSGTATTLVGVAIGLAATLAVGTVTFFMQQKLPYKRMLIVTGVLIALVLAVMTGITAHTMQGLGWLPIHDTSFRTPFWASTRLGLFPTWETIGAELASLVFVIGSYVLARQLVVQRRRVVLAG